MIRGTLVKPHERLTEVKNRIETKIKQIAILSGQMYNSVACVRERKPNDDDECECDEEQDTWTTFSDARKWAHNSRCESQRNYITL